jgi:phage tail sheath protein FI
MPPTLSFPGVYIQEVPSPVHTITGVPTAVAAFIGRARRGPTNTPVRIHSFADFERTFGPLWNQSELGYTVQQYFQNGGSDAYVVRTVNAALQSSFNASPPSISIPTGGVNPVLIQPRFPGSWFANVSGVVDYNTRKVGNPPVTLADEFNLTITLAETDPISGAQNQITESFRNLTADPTKANFLKLVVENDSKLYRIGDPQAAVGTRPNTGPFSYGGPAVLDGTLLAATDLVPLAGKTGVRALDDAEIFTILVFPPYSPNESATPDLSNTVWSSAVAYLQEGHRAMLLIDPPSTWIDEPTALQAITTTSIVDNLRDKNTALYYPWIYFADPLMGGRARLFAPSASVAGVMARIDSDRGVWKAPAGEEATISGVQKLQYLLTDPENGDLNPLAINCLRTFPIVGTVVWGARTLVGADAQGSEWKYIPVRRTALFIEESLYRGTKWVVFEPNDEPLWAQIRLNVGAFMRSLFRQGAFQGLTPKDAYFVKCDSDTTTQDDINRGIVNILVGFAPLKPAEFVVIQISQIAGNITV